ncbi:MAG: DMT family transporter [Desulfobacterales bacterium]|nr:DMT family transporter [Desulfobacterales bacterium]
METKDYLDLKAVVILIIVTLLWGFNHPAIKISNQGVSPIFASTLRSIVASICGLIYCLRKGEKIFHKDVTLFHGVMVGLLFGVEFACIYFGLLYTDAARSVLFVYLSPFVVAIGAHFFLKGDRLTFLKILGLVLAFTGIFVVFGGRPKTAKAGMYFGDILQIAAGVLWGATTLYIKKFMAKKVEPINTFFYQLFFSIPILLVVSIILEPKWIYKVDPYVVGSLFYQSVIIAFITYFVWFKLIHGYSVSRLSAFTFLTPIFGVLFGVFFLHEELTVSLMIGLPLVSAGIFLVNWRRRAVY